MQDLLFFQLSLEVKTVSVIKDKYMQIIRVKIHIQKFFHIQEFFTAEIKWRNEIVILYHKSYNFIEIIEFRLYYLSFHVRVRNLETLDKMEVSNKFKEFVKSWEKTRFFIPPRVVWCYADLHSDLEKRECSSLPKRIQKGAKRMREHIRLPSDACTSSSSHQLSLVT